MQMEFPFGMTEEERRRPLANHGPVYTRATADAGLSTEATIVLSRL